SVRTPRPATSTPFPYTPLFRSRPRRTIASWNKAIAGILTDQDARRSRVLASFSLRSGAQVPTYVHCACGAPSPSARAVGLRALRSEEHTSELQSRENLVCRLLL